MGRRQRTTTRDESDRGAISAENRGAPPDFRAVTPLPGPKTALAELERQNSRPTVVVRHRQARTDSTAANAHSEALR
jgi:hypothetical protein